MFGEIGLGAIAVAYVGALEIRIRNLVNKDRFQDLRDDVRRIDKKIDALLIHNNLDPKDNDTKR